MNRVTKNEGPIEEKNGFDFQGNHMSNWQPENTD